MIQLERELQQLRKRLVRIETALNLPPLAEPPAEAPTSAPAADTPAAPAPKPTAAAPAPARPAAPPRTAYEPARPGPRKEGGFLGAIAILCFVLAAVYLIQLAISSGWLTPARQLGLLFTSGFALVGAALWTRERDAEYSGFLAAGGVIILYLAAYAGHLYFGLIDQVITLVLVGGIGLFNLYLFRKFESNFFLVTGAAGVFLGPILLGRFNDQVGLVCGYNLIWSLVFSLISIRIEARLLSAISAYFAFGSVGLMATTTVASHPEDAIPLLFTQTIQFFLFSLAIIRHSILHRTPLSESEAMTYFPVVLIFYASEYYLLNQVMPGGAPWVSLCFGLILVFLSRLAQARLDAEHLPSTQLVTTFASLCLFHSFYLEIMPDDARHFLVPVILALAIFLPRNNLQGSTWFAPKIAVLVMLAIEGQKVFWKMLGDPSGDLIAVAFVAAILLLVWPIQHRPERGEVSDNWYVPLATGHILAMQSLYQVTRGIGSLAVSVAWGLYAICVLVFGFSRRDVQFARSATIILLFTTMKVFLYDIAASSAPIRILSLAVTGVVLYLSGFLFRRISELKS